MAKTTQAALTDDELMAELVEEVEAEFEGLSMDQLEKLTKQSLISNEVQKRKRAEYSKANRERQKLYNKKRQIRAKILEQKAKELGIEVNDEDVELAMRSA